jgi:hypothetical protein
LGGAEQGSLVGNGLASRGNRLSKGEVDRPGWKIGHMDHMMGRAITLLFFHPMVFGKCLKSYYPEYVLGTLEIYMCRPTWRLAAAGMSI